MRTALVLGGHGFIGHHIARKLKHEGFWVRTVDINHYPYDDLFIKEVDDYVIADLRNMHNCLQVTDIDGGFDEVYNMAFWMGGAGVIFTGVHDAEIMHSSALIELNVAEACYLNKAKKIFVPSSACIYPAHNQTDPNNPNCAENSAYPADPDSDYGFTKLFGERLWAAYHRNRGLNVRIARFHNIFGEESAWDNGKEKSPAAVARKIARAENGDTIEIWGDGQQTRSFLHIDECMIGVRKFMGSDFMGPLNIGSDEMVSINQLVEITKEIAGKPDIKIKHIPGPLGVRGRNSDNTLIREKLGWAPSLPLRYGMEKVYAWIDGMVRAGKTDAK